MASGWNKSAEAYRPFEVYTAQFTVAAAEGLPDFLGSKDGISVMDVAAGTGASTFALCQRLAKHCRANKTTAQVVATDFSEAMLKSLMEKLNASDPEEEVKSTQVAIKEGLLSVSAKVADAQDLSAFADESLDAITCTFGIMFPPSPSKVVREFWRLLKPGGVVITTTWHYNNMVSDTLSDLAHTFMGKDRFEDPPLLTSTMKFGTEMFMRRLFRGDLDGVKLFRDADLEARFVSGSAKCLPRHIAAMLNKNPVSTDYGTWDEAAAEKHLQETLADADGLIKLHGTALILIARKPAIWAAMGGFFKRFLSYSYE